MQEIKISTSEIKAKRMHKRIKDHEKWLRDDNYQRKQAERARRLGRV